MIACTLAGGLVFFSPFLVCVGLISGAHLCVHRHRRSYIERNPAEWEALVKNDKRRRLHQRLQELDAP